MAKNRLDICKQAWADKSKARTAAAERRAADPSMREWDVKVKRRHADDYREAAESLGRALQGTPTADDTKRLLRHAESFRERAAEAGTLTAALVAAPSTECSTRRIKRKARLAAHMALLATDLEVEARPVPGRRALRLGGYQKSEQGSQRPTRRRSSTALRCAEHY